MNPYAYLAAIVLAVSLLTGVYLKGRHDEAADAIERERDGLLAYAEKIKKGVEQHDKDQTVLAGLRTELDRLRNTVRFPVCTKDTDEAGRLLSERVDEEFGKLQEVVGRLIEESDKLNADAIRTNSLIP